MLTQHIALVPEADGVDASELARVSAALQKQVTRDLSPAWGIAATVDAFPHLEDVPIGYWPIIVGFGDLGSQAGIHVDRNGQPYALVQVGKGWSLAASRACLEMLVNPFENRTISAPSLRSDQAPVEFLIEVCAPCEDGRHAYSVNGVVVSDFCTPAFFGVRNGGSSERFSWSGAITTPLRVTAGGHVTWYEPVSGSWWLRSHWGENPVDTQIGPVDRKLFSVRELVQACGLLRVAPKTLPHEAFEGRAAQARQASVVQAQRMRSLLGSRGAELDAAIESIWVPRAAESSQVTPMRYSTAAQAREQADDDVEVILEIDGDGDYDFDYDEPTFPNTPARAAEPAPAQTVRTAEERQTPPPFPAPGSARASTSSGTAPARSSAPSKPVASKPAASKPAVSEAVESRRTPSSLTPISIPSMPEVSSHRGRSQFVGGAIGVAGLLAAMLWIGRASLAGSPVSRPATPPAALGTPPAEPVAAAIVPVPVAVEPVAVEPVAVEAAPKVEAKVEPKVASKVEEIAEARPTKPVQPAADRNPAPAIEAQRSHHRARASLPPPEPVATQSAPSRTDHDAIADLIDTRR